MSTGIQRSKICYSDKSDLEIPSTVMDRDLEIASTETLLIVKPSIVR